MCPDVTISGGNGKVQHGLVLEGARCDELAAVRAHISDIARTPEYERGIHAHNQKWNFQLNPLATPSLQACGRSRHSITLL